MAELNPNAITGLGSKLNIQEIIGKFIAIEKRKVAPVESRKAEKTLELDSWNAIKMEVEKLHGVVKTLSKSDLWDAKTVKSSDPTVIEVKALRSAKPGKTNIAVDAVALSHQITSQGYESKDDNVGTGNIKIQVGDSEENSPVTIQINSAHNTLDGVAQAINDSDAEVEAFVIKVGSSEKPYQLLLTSDVTGERGRIEIDVEIKNGDVEPPTYENTFDKTSEWEGIGAQEPSTDKRGTGHSSAITGVQGTFQGEDDTEYTFTVIQGGIVNSEQGVVISWEDGQGNSGSFELNKFNYSPGQPLEFADGLKFLISDGELIPGDSFQVIGRAERSALFWWLTDAERAPQVEGPSDWQKKSVSGGIKVEGTYTGEEEQTVVFRIEGSGQVGGQKPMFLHYEFTETGEIGKVNISYPYLSDLGDPNALESATAYDFLDGEGLFTLDFNRAGGNQKLLNLPNGLTVEIPSGLLKDGDTADALLKPKISDRLWWLPDDIRGNDGKIDETLEWRPYLDDDGNEVSSLNVKDGLLAFGSQFSSAEIQIAGDFLEDVEKIYTFTALKKGTVGITRVLEIKWDDNMGRSGTIDFGEGYEAGTLVPFDSGLSVSLGAGDFVMDDTFTVETRTSTVQPPQDAILRLGASDLGGGIEIARPTNTVKDVIQGVELNLLSISEKPITITVRGDTERAKESVRDFVEAYNTLNGTVTEFTKFNPSTNKGGPLLSDRNIVRIHNEIANTTVSSVPGLSRSVNMLFAVGVRIDAKGNMSLNESKLDEKIDDDFAAVANIFRSNGESENNSISFLGLTDKTKISPTGYDVDISQVPVQGTYTGTPLPAKVRINELNNEIIVTADGRSSDVIKLREDEYTASTLAKSIQSKLADDKKLGKRRIRVIADEGRLKFISGSYGVNSSIKVEPGKDKNISNLGLTNGTTIEGKDTVGTIDGIPATGRGQLLVGKDDTNAEGLRLFINLTEEELGTGSETKVILTKGIGTQLEEKLKEYLDPIQGDIKQSTKDISEQIKAFDEQVKQLNERIETKREELQRKFAKLDSKMGRLKAQQNYLGQQLSALSPGKKGN